MEKTDIKTALYIISILSSCLYSGGGGSRTPVLTCEAWASTGLGSLSFFSDPSWRTSTRNRSQPAFSPGRSAGTATGKSRKVTDNCNARNKAKHCPSFNAYAARAKVPLLLALKSFPECKSRELYLPPMTRIIPVESGAPPYNVLIYPITTMQVKQQIGRAHV